MTRSNNIDFLKPSITLMKTSTILLSAIALAFVFSCQSANEASIDQLIKSNDESAMREARAALNDERSAIDQQIEQLDLALAKLSSGAALPLVAAINAIPASFDHYVELQGTVKTLKNVMVYPEMPGILKSVVVREGQRVKKGAVLAYLDDGGLAAQFEQAKSQLALAKTVFERQERLWNNAIGSEIQYLQSKTNFESAQSAVNALETQLDKSIVRAPFDGIVDEVFKEQGVFVSPGPGAELFRVVNLDRVFVEVDVPEIHISTIQIGTTAQVNIRALGKEIEAKVTQSSNVISTSNRSFKIEVALSNEDSAIKPNLTAMVRLNDYSNPSAILVPQSIVSENAEGQQYCFALREENDEYKVERRIVTTGKTQGDVIELIDGVEAGELLVTDGSKKVTNGQQVQLIKG